MPRGLEGTRSKVVIEKQERGRIQRLREAIWNALGHEALLPKEYPQKNRWSRILTASYRLPGTVKKDSRGRWTSTKSSGGLAAALSMLGVEAKWYGVPGPTLEKHERYDDDPGLAEALRSMSDETFEIGPIRVTKRENTDFYEGYANSILVSILVGQPDKKELQNLAARWNTYKGFQDRFAKQMMKTSSSDDIIWIHDYQLMGVGKALETRGNTQPTGFFLHTPFPTVEDFDKLPEGHPEALIKDLLAYDLIGFQTPRFKKRFVEAVKKYIRDPAPVFEETESPSVTITHFGNRKIRIGSFPISIDAESFKRKKEAPETQKNIKRIETALANEGKKMIYSVGRSDYTKGFYEELLAFRHLLRTRPELRDKVVLVQQVIPSRDTIKAYQAYKEEIQRLAREIKEEFGDVVKRPGVLKQLHTSMNEARYLAHLAAADVVSFPSLGDGMGLIPKEAAVVGKPLMTQVMGTEPGVVDELGEYALTADPRSPEAYADALYQALTLSENDRIERRAGMKAVVEHYDVHKWWRDQEGCFQKIWNEKRDYYRALATLGQQD